MVDGLAHPARRFGHGLYFALSLAVMMIGLGIAIPWGRYADRDDAPGDMVIAFLIFVAAAVAAMWIVNPRERAKPRTPSR